MIGIGLSITKAAAMRGGGGGGGPDADATAIINRMSAITTPPDAARQTLIDARVKGLKSKGIWQKLDVLYMLWAHTNLASLINWKSPLQYNMTVDSPTTFTVDRGHADFANTSLLNTNFSPRDNGVNWTLNNGSFGVWAQTTPPADDNGNGTIGIGNRSRLFTRYEAQVVGEILSVIGSGLGFRANFASTAYPLGLYGANRTASNAAKGIKGGVLSTNTDTAPPDTAPPSTLTVFQVNGVNAANSPRVAVVWCGAAFTQTELTDFQSEMQAWATAVGA